MRRVTPEQFAKNKRGLKDQLILIVNSPITPAGSIDQQVTSTTSTAAESMITQHSLPISQLLTIEMVDQMTITELKSALRANFVNGLSGLKKTILRERITPFICMLLQQSQC